jgi:hypothetical protein
VDELRYIESFGIGVARRGWVESKHVINTMPVDQMLAVLRVSSRSRAAARKRRKKKAKRTIARSSATGSSCAGSPCPTTPMPPRSTPRSRTACSTS